MYEYLKGNQIQEWLKQLEEQKKKEEDLFLNKVSFKNKIDDHLNPLFVKNLVDNTSKRAYSNEQLRMRRSQERQ